MSLAGFQPQHTGFQGGHTGFQQTFFSGGSGSDSGYKLDSSAFADVFMRFREKHEEKLDVIPEKVINIIKTAAKSDDGSKDREKIIKERLSRLELKYRREWLRLSDELHKEVQRQEARELKKNDVMARRKSDELAVMLLLM